MTTPADRDPLIPDHIYPGALADPAPWNESGGPYRLPRPTRILDVRTGNFTTGIGVLVDCGAKHGQRWLSAAWFRWDQLLFLV